MSALRLDGDRLFTATIGMVYCYSLSGLEALEAAVDGSSAGPEAALSSRLPGAISDQAVAAIDESLDAATGHMGRLTIWG